MRSAGQVLSIRLLDRLLWSCDVMDPVKVSFLSSFPSPPPSAMWAISDIYSGFYQSKQWSSLVKKSSTSQKWMHLYFISDKGPALYRFMEGLGCNPNTWCYMTHVLKANDMTMMMTMTLTMTWWQWWWQWQIIYWNHNSETKWLTLTLREMQTKANSWRICAKESHPFIRNASLLLWSNWVWGNL